MEEKKEQLKRERNRRRISENEEIEDATLKILREYLRKWRAEKWISTTLIFMTSCTGKEREKKMRK